MARDVIHIILVARWRIKDRYPCENGWAVAVASLFHQVLVTLPQVLLDACCAPATRTREAPLYSRGGDHIRCVQ